MNLTRRNLSGKAHFAAVTDLLQRIRLEDAYAGLYEAADLQWWSREDDAAFPERQVYWFNAQGNAVACLLLYDGGQEWNNDFLYLPSAKQVLEQQVIPEVVRDVSILDKVSTITVRDDDQTLQQALEAVGFVRGDVAHIVTELASDPAKTQLPPGFQLSSRVEDKLPHHLLRRNSSDVERRLGECSLYRPELDLCVRDASGNVAAYVLFWMDDVTKVGLIEPVRTEKEFQRMGLARHLIAEGIAHLRELGAESVRVAYSTGNPAAANLYHQVGFVDKIKCLEYRRDRDPVTL